MSKRNISLLVSIAVIAALGILIARHFYANRAAADPKWPAMQTITWYPDSRQLANFKLEQSDGTILTPEKLRGRWTLIFLGFTYCPDICPTTLFELSHAQKRWQALHESIRPRVLFVSADPERDTPEQLNSYVKAFHPDTLAATADLEMLARFVKPLNLVFRKVPRKDYPDDPMDYGIDHSANIAVVDPNGRVAGVIRPPLNANAIANDLIDLTQFPSTSQ